MVEGKQAAVRSRTWEEQGGAWPLHVRGRLLHIRDWFLHVRGRLLHVRAEGGGGRGRRGEGAAGGRREEQEGAFYVYLGEPRT